MAVTKKVMPKGTKVAVKTSTEVKHGKTGAEVVKEEIQSMVEVKTPYANVGVTASRTINLGDFNNVKLGVSIYRPCNDTEEAIEEAYEFCVAFVDDKMEALTKDHDTPAED